MTPKPQFVGVPRGHFAILGGPFWWPGPPRGSQRGPSVVKGGFLLDFGCPWGPPWGSLWYNFSDLLEFFGVKVGGWVADLLFKRFWVGKVTSAVWPNVVKPL